jgi:hypothetical protein
MLYYRGSLLVKPILISALFLRDEVWCEVALLQYDYLIAVWDIPSFQINALIKWYIYDTVQQYLVRLLMFVKEVDEICLFTYFQVMLVTESLKVIHFNKIFRNISYNVLIILVLFFRPFCLILHKPTNCAIVEEKAILHAIRLLILLRRKF